MDVLDHKQIKKERQGTKHQVNSTRVHRLHTYIQIHVHLILTINTYRISDTNISNDAIDLNLNNNPAYDTQTTLHKNVAYEDSTLHTGKEQQFSAQLSTTEPTYEIIQPAINQVASIPTVMSSKEGGDDMW